MARTLQVEKRWYVWQTKVNTDLDEEVTVSFCRWATNSNNITLKIVQYYMEKESVDFKVLVQSNIKLRNTAFHCIAVIRDNIKQEIKLIQEFHLKRWNNLIMFYINILHYFLQNYLFIYF